MIARRVNCCEQRRAGATLVHVQAAIAVGAIVIATVATSLTALYRLQETADELRERSAVAYRFEHRLRQDARAADGVQVEDGGALLLNVRGAEVRYEVDEGDVLRTAKRNGKTLHDVMRLPEAAEAHLGYNEGAHRIELLVKPSANSSGGVVLQRRIHATLGRAPAKSEAAP